MIIDSLLKTLGLRDTSAADKLRQLARSEARGTTKTTDVDALRDLIRPDASGGASLSDFRLMVSVVQRSDELEKTASTWPAQILATVQARADVETARQKRNEAIQRATEQLRAAELAAAGVDAKTILVARACCLLAELTDQYPELLKTEPVDLDLFTLRTVDDVIGAIDPAAPERFVGTGTFQRESIRRHVLLTKAAELAAPSAQAPTWSDIVASPGLLRRLERTIATEGPVSSPRPSTP